MAEIWPVGLPAGFMLGTYAFQTGDGRLRDRPDAGPAMVRRRSSAAPGRLKGDIVLTLDQYDALVGFGETNLVGWTGTFAFPSQTRAGIKHLVRFAEQLPVVTRLGQSRVRVSFDLEVLSTGTGPGGLDFSDPDNSQYIPLM